MKIDRKLSGAVAAVLLTGMLGACSSKTAKAPAPTPASTTVAAPGGGPLVTASPPTPKANQTQAVTALLSAEQANDHNASFGLIDEAGRAVYPTAPDWARRRSELAPITKFVVESTSGDDVTALVDHQPGIDPFIGLHFAQEHQVWHAVRASGGWLVDPDPRITPIVAADTGADPAALAWARAIQACDTAGAAKLQAVDPLLGVSAGPGALCHAAGPVTADPPAPADQGPQTADLVAQYTVDVLPYVRKVHLTGIPAPFDAYLVPIGASWQVVAVGG